MPRNAMAHKNKLVIVENLWPPRLAQPECCAVYNFMLRVTLGCTLRPVVKQVKRRSRTCISKPSETMMK